MNRELLENNIRTIPDFPKPGIQFKDISTLLLKPAAFQEVIDIFYTQFKDSNIDVVVGAESRGFIFAAPLALRLKCGFALARKPGKLPGETISAEYALEYGIDKIEMHSDAIKSGARVLIIDDLLATGGTAAAVGELVQQLGGETVSYAFLINLTFLNGATALLGSAVFSILDY